MPSNMPIWSVSNSRTFVIQLVRGCELTLRPLETYGFAMGQVRGYYRQAERNPERSESVVLARNLGKQQLDWRDADTVSVLSAQRQYR